MKKSRSCGAGLDYFLSFFAYGLSASLLIGCKVIKVKAKVKRYVVIHLFSYFWCKSTFFLFINNNEGVFFDCKLHFFKLISMHKI
jgi:hypothetical protein